MSLNIKNTNGTLTKVAGNNMLNVKIKSSSIDEIQDTPVGHILTYMGNSAPAHYLICDGTEYNIADYLDLANHFKKEFGEINYFGGDGVVTFAVPDLRGEFLRGTGENSHENQGNGSEVGEHQDATNHIYSFLTISSNADSRTFTFPDDTITSDNFKAQNIDSYVGHGSKRKSAAKGSVESYGGPSYYTSHPTNTSVLYCVKYEPTYYVESNDAGYSLEETFTGKRWIDGKPIYRKVITFNDTLCNSQTWQTVAPAPEGIERIIDATGFSDSNTLYPIITLAYENNIRIINVRKEAIVFTSIIIEYTKTTD